MFYYFLFGITQKTQKRAACCLESWTQEQLGVISFSDQSLLLQANASFKTIVGVACSGSTESSDIWSHFGLQDVIKCLYLFYIIISAVD